MKINSKNQCPVPSDFAGFLLWQAANKWEKYLNTQLKPFGLNQAEVLHLISIFHLLQSQSEEITQSVLAQYTGVTAMSVSKILTKLEKQGLILRSVGTDSRSKSVLITKIGEKLLIQTAQILSKANDDFYPSKSRPKLINYLNNL